MRPANVLVAKLLAELRDAARPGVTTADLDQLAEKRIRAEGGEPAFKGYHGYPATICASGSRDSASANLRAIPPVPKIPHRTVFICFPIYPEPLRF